MAPLGGQRQWVTAVEWGHYRVCDAGEENGWQNPPRDPLIDSLIDSLRDPLIGPLMV